MADKDFVFRIRNYSLMTLNIFYYMPDHQHIIQEFLWQTMDLKPKYPRIKEFLKFWQEEIDAKIKEIQIGEENSLQPSKYKNVEQIFRI